MKYKIPSNIAWRRIDREIIILKTDSGEYYSLANAGADAWEWLAAGMELATAAADLTKIYSLSQKEADKDVAALAAKLEQTGLLEPDRASGPSTKTKTTRGLTRKQPYAKPQLTRHSSKSYAWATY